MANEENRPVANPALAANNPDAADFVQAWQGTYEGREYDLAGDAKAKYDLVEGVQEMAKYAASNGNSAKLTVSTNADGVTRLVMDVVPKAAN